MTGVADFTGYATRNDVVCTDGRTILAGAFAHQSGEEVPLVWNHGHDDPFNVLGHVILENVADGVLAHAYFNDTDRAQHIKSSVKNGDIKFMSIFANGLRERSKQVAHGIIREVSLVLGGANPGATIDNLSIVHNDGDMDIYDEAEITTGIAIQTRESISHAASTAVEVEVNTEERSVADVMSTLNEEQLTAVNFLLSQALTVEGDIQHSAVEDEADADTDGDDEDKKSDESTDADAEEETEVEESSEEENSEAEESSDDDAEEGSEDAESEEADDTTDGEGDESADADSDNSTDTEAGDEAVQHDNINQEDTSMTHNVFDQSKQGASSSATGERSYLSHDAWDKIKHDTIKKGSLKEALGDYIATEGIQVGGTLQHGIENIEYLFPDPKTITTQPSWIAREVKWVRKVLDGVNKTPFSRIRTIHADITADEARARGYVKGNLKVEEMFTLLKRDTTPQTIYKKQKLDRDDVLDITDLDVIAYVKAEMKLMLDEEIAGAILIGDARSNGDDDKIKEDKVRPIMTDAELYTLTYNVNLDDASSSVDELIDAILEARSEWKGTGTPTFYTSNSIAAKFRTLKDGFQHRMYKNLTEVAEALDVAEVVPVEIFNRFPNLVGILVNLSDYSIGTDRGGQATMFDDFDLDYNKYRYLLETRMCGALTVPHSAQVFVKTASTDVILPQPTPPSFSQQTNVITIPTTTNVTYKNGATTLTAGAQTALTPGQKFTVTAVPASGKKFPSNSQDEWTYKGEA